MKRSEIYLTVDTLMNYPLCRSEYDLIPVENRFNPGVHWATMAPRFAPQSSKIWAIRMKI